MDAYTPFTDFHDWKATPVSFASFDRQLDSLRTVRDAATSEQLRLVEHIALRQAAVETGAIEGLYATDRGFTLSVALASSAIEVAVARIKGPEVADLIRDQLKAYEHILDVATGHHALIEKTVRDLHAITTRSQQTYSVLTPMGMQTRPLLGGAYKAEPNNPTRPDGEVHHYAPPEDVAPEMGRLIEQVASAAFHKAHPVLQAAYVHWAFVAIHPFADGNGRVARQLASLPLYRAASTPLLIFSDQRESYLLALEAADAGDVAPWCRFVLERAVDTLELVALRLQQAGRDDADPLTSLKAALLSTDEEGARVVNSAAGRVLDALAEEARTQARELPWPDLVTVEIGEPVEFTGPVPEGYRNVRAAPSQWAVHINSAGPAWGYFHRTFQIAVSLDTAQGTRFLLHAVGGLPQDEAFYVPPLEIPLRQVHPVMSEVFSLKAQVWISEMLHVARAKVAAEGIESLKRGGLL